MVLPHPESDLSMNIMVMSSDLVKILRGQGGFIFEETLLNNFVKNDKRRTPEMFVDCLTFLFSFGFIEHSGYRVKLSEDALRKPDQMSLIFD